MIFYSDKNVYEAAKDRIRYLYNEFYPQRKIVVDFSGGKDSTTVLHLVQEVTQELGIAKVPVMFLDQELEAPQVVEYVRWVMHQPWVEPYWIQSYFREWNASQGKWFNVWGPGEKWAREKEPDSYGDLDFKVKEDFPKVMSSALASCCGYEAISLGGVRIEESPNRRSGLTRGDVYKGITWGKCLPNGQLIFYPIWDWSYKDVWYYIFSNHFPYCKLYNYYITQKPLNKCRVSSFIHENSIQGIKEMKEVSPKFYAALMKRVANVNTTVQSFDALWDYVGSLPPYFKDWDDYIQYLAIHLCGDAKNAKKVIQGYTTAMKKYRSRIGKCKKVREAVDKWVGSVVAGSIVAEDFELSKLGNAGLSIYKYIREHDREIKEANQ